MKDEILKQIKAEFRTNSADKQAELDAAYYLELAKSGKASRKKYSPPDIQTELGQRLKHLSGIKINSNNFSVDIFKDPKIKSEYKKTYDKLSQYCEKFPNVKISNILLCGAAGTGKTHAAQVVGAKLLDRGFSVIYITAFSLIQRFKDFVFNFESAALNHFFTCDLLIIDDLGTEPKIKNISDEYLLNVINERMANNSPFIITTNLAPNDILARYDERLTSRILSKQSSVVIEMKSKDLRLS